MRIQPTDLSNLAQAYQQIITESHGTAGEGSDIQHSDQEAYQDAEGGARTSTYKTVQPGMGKSPETPTQSFEQRLLQAAQNGELTKDLVTQIVSEIWDAAQEAYADMSAQYESELD